MRRLLCLLALASVLPASSALATELRPIVLDPSYQHDRFVTEPQDHVRHFRAYTVSFDGDDDNDGDDEGDVWGIPEWVAYEIKRHDGPVPSAFEGRPSPWMDDDELVEASVCLTDDSYLHSGYALTGLDFLTSLDEELEAELERVVPIALWPTVQPEFLAGPTVPRRLDMTRERIAPPSGRPAMPPGVEPAVPSAPASPYAWSQPMSYYQHYNPCYPARVIWVRRCR